jgi:hypothetical protein
MMPYGSALSENGGEKMEKEYEQREAWYDLYRVSNWLNNREKLNDTYFWFAARRDGALMEDIRATLEQVYREELGVPIHECEMWNILTVKA